MTAGATAALSLSNVGGWFVGCRKMATNTILMINIRERGKKWKRVAES
jgi:hypothetical protein